VSSPPGEAVGAIGYRDRSFEVRRERYPLKSGCVMECEQSENAALTVNLVNGSALSSFRNKPSRSPKFQHRRVLRIDRVEQTFNL